MQVPFLKGVYASDLEVRTAYPRNMIPIPKETGLGNGYFKPAEGIVQLGSDNTYGLDRGSINWNGTCYRVLGSRLVKVESDGTLVVIGVVGNNAKPVSFDYSFDRLAIASNEKLYYYDGVSLTVVTDPDLGVVLDVIWVDGYFMTTDGEYLVVTELTDPAAVDPLKYGSSETDPDPVVGICKLRNNEPYAINRHSIEAFDDVGSSNFPFSRIDGAQISRGAIGTHAFCKFVDGIAFIGSGRDEGIAVWYGYNGGSTKLSSDEVDIILKDYTEEELSEVEIESRIIDGHDYLYIHLPCGTYVYDHNATQAASTLIWYIMDSTVLGGSEYRARHFTFCYNKWIVGDTDGNRLGYMTDSVGSHWSEVIGWEFRTDILFNSGKSGIIHDIEIFGLPGQAAYGENPTIWTSYSTDGETFGAEHPLSCGTQGEYQKRLVWFGQGMINKWRIQKFRGLSDARLPIMRIEANVEVLNY